MKSASIMVALCLGLISPLAWSQAAEVQEALKPVSLSELASEAEVIVLAQARDTDYALKRDYPVRGSAFLRVLIPYKVDRPLDIVEVYEEGLHRAECYFQNPTVFEEGRRYLLFLKRDPEDEERYRGLDSGCALDVLVDENYRYVLRLPADGISLSDTLAPHAETLRFADVYARETDETLNSAQRDAWLDAGWIEPITENAIEGYVYTQGVDLKSIRELMGPAGVSDDRHLKRVPEDP